MSEQDEKKERVIHTRVPPSLDEELRKRAAGLGVSVSNLVRNVLNHTFGLVEDVIADGANVARQARGQRPLAAPGSPPGPPPGPASATPPAPVLVGWQRLVLSVNALCGRCNAILPSGGEAALAVTQPPTAARAFLCVPCLERETGDPGAPAPGAAAAAVVAAAQAEQRDE
jgi:hypothetical protein